MAEPASSRRTATGSTRRAGDDGEPVVRSWLRLSRPALNRIALSSGIVLLSLLLILTIGINPRGGGPLAEDARADGARTHDAPSRPGPRPYATVPPAGVAAPPDRPNASDQAALRSWAHRVSARTSIPAPALVAYGRAEMWMRHKRAGCHISWSTLAAIGRLASAHGTRPGAVGGTGNTRMMGPLRIPPRVWQRWAARASGDGATPRAGDLGDSALTVARFLCASGNDMRAPKGWWTAVVALRNSVDYAERVYSVAKRYALASRP